MKRLFPLMLAAAALSNCAGPRPVPAEAVTPSKTWGGAESRIGATEYHLVATDAAWKALWSRHAGDASELPKIDFATTEVIACFWGPRDMRGTFTTSVTRDGRRYHVVFGSYTGDAYPPPEPPKPTRFMMIELPRLPLPVTVAGSFRSMIEPNAYKVLAELPAP